MLPTSRQGRASVVARPPSPHRSAVRLVAAAVLASSPLLRRVVQEDVASPPSCSRNGTPLRRLRRSGGGGSSLAGWLQASGATASLRSTQHAGILPRQPRQLRQQRAHRWGRCGEGGNAGCRYTELFGASNRPRETTISAVWPPLLCMRRRRAMHACPGGPSCCSVPPITDWI